MTDKKQALRSPKGTASYPHLTKPSTTFDKEGKYEVDLILDPSDPEVAAFVESIEAFRDSETPGGNSPIREQLDKDKRPTGMLSCKFRSNFRPAIFDSRRNPWPADVQIGSGSVIRVAYLLNTYEKKKDMPNGGVNLYLQGVQVLELVEYVGKDAASLGFEEEEGYEVEPEKRGDQFVDGVKVSEDAAQTKPSQPARAPATAEPQVASVLRKLGLYDKVVAAEIPMSTIEQMWETCKKSETMLKIRVNSEIAKKGK